ncbi:hypothetical protein [Mycobacterium malmoense]|uniref:hypothetical protein n=1 Tax=Mycobacterium malmoense TaxID=1780 RepID=UPI00114D4967|nr:hypothetical protein [Mycobacterium malmoense]
MSKESKPRDRWHQVFAAATDRSGHCPGCGYYHAAHGQHRVDCMAPDVAAEREDTQQGHCAGCDHMRPLDTLAWDRYRWLCAECRSTAAVEVSA